MHTMWFVPGPRVTNSENCFRGFTTYFDKKLGQKELFRLFFLLRTIQPATWLPSKCSRQTMLAQSAWRCMSTMLRYWCCPSMRTQTDAPTVRAVIQPAASHLTCVGRSRKRHDVHLFPLRAAHGHNRSVEHPTGTAAALSTKRARPQR